MINAEAVHAAARPSVHAAIAQDYVDTLVTVLNRVRTAGTPTYPT